MDKIQGLLALGLNRGITGEHWLWLNEEAAEGSQVGTEIGRGGRARALGLPWW